MWRLCNCLSSREYNHVVKFHLTSWPVSCRKRCISHPWWGCVLTRGRAPILHFRRCARFIPLRSTEAESQLSSHHHVEFENRLTSSSIICDSANLVLYGAMNHRYFPMHRTFCFVIRHFESSVYFLIGSENIWIKMCHFMNRYRSSD